MGHAIRVITDLDVRATVLSVDGVGAYDHVLRSSMLEKLWEVLQLRPLIPFVRSTCAQPTSYEWEDQHGTRHQIWQLEGLLFCLAVHNALAEIQEQLGPGEHVFAFLDDIYVVSPPERTRTILNLAAEKLGAGAGIELHAGTKLVCGTGRASVLLISLNLERTSGTQPASKSSGLPWDRRNSRKLLVP